MFHPVAAASLPPLNPHPDWGLVTRQQWNAIIRDAARELGNNSPTFEFRADQAPKIFIRYARHFENTWKLAKDWPS